MNKAEIVSQFSNFLDLITSHGCDQFQSLTTRVDDIHSNYNIRLDSVVANLSEVEDKIGSMLNDISNLKDEFANYQKVSIVKNLNQQLHERNIELGHLQKKVAKLEADAVVSAEPVTVEEEEEAVEEAVEEATDEVTEEATEEEVVEEEVVTEEVTEEITEEVTEEEVVEEEVVAEEATEEATEEAAEEDEEEGVSLVEKMLKGPKDKKKRMYFVTDDEDRDIYDVDAEGDPSDEPVGKLVGKTGRAKWF